MKRKGIRQIVLKEPKIEEPDDNVLMKEPKVEPEDVFEEKVLKEEPIDEEYEEKPPKTDDFGVKDPKLEEPEFKVPQDSPPNFPVWRPNIKCVTDFLNDDTDQMDCGMMLGNSLLFDNCGSMPYKSEQKYDSGPQDYAPFEEEEEEIPSGKKALAPNKIRAELLKSFNSNPHQTALECQLLSEEIGVRYKTVIDYFESRRKTKQIKCQENDPCQRIKKFFIRESESLTYAKITDEVRAALEDEIEKHMTCQKRFSVGYVHVVMDRTNLHPSYIRGQYETWKRKLIAKDRENYKITDYKKDEEDQTNLLSIEILRQLEEAYLRKKYHCVEKEWSPKDIKALAKQVEVDEEVINTWIEKRRDAKMGLDKGEAKAGFKYATGYRKLPRHKLESLNSEFVKDPKPSMSTRFQIAKSLGLNEMQVRNYFNKKRIAIKKRKVWEKARLEFMTLTPAKKEQMEKLAAEKRKPANENVQIARRMGVTYQTLVSFIDWRKSLSAAKYNKFHY